MAISYYPDSTVKRAKHVVEELQDPSIYYSLTGMQDLTGVGLSTRFWFPRSWDAKRVAMHFSNSNVKSFAMSVMPGRGVVTGKNDQMLFKVAGGSTQVIVLDQGFYTGAEIALQLKSKLDANATFVALGATPFTVSYNITTGLFAVTPAGGLLLDYCYYDSTFPVGLNRSSAGVVFGMTQNSGLVASVTSNVAAPALGTATVFVSGSATGTTDVMSTETLSMSVDDALLLTVSAVATTVNYEVVYRLMSI